MATFNTTVKTTQKVWFLGPPVDSMVQRARDFNFVVLPWELYHARPVSFGRSLSQPKGTNKKKGYEYFCSPRLELRVTLKQNAEQGAYLPLHKALRKKRERLYGPYNAGA